jgi:hypothetical protein
VHTRLPPSHTHSVLLFEFTIIGNVSKLPSEEQAETLSALRRELRDALVSFNEALARSFNERDSTVTLPHRSHLGLLAEFRANLSVEDHLRSIWSATTVHLLRSMPLSSSGSAPPASAPKK